MEKEHAATALNELNAKKPLRKSEPPSTIPALDQKRERLGPRTTESCLAVSALISTHTHEKFKRPAFTERTPRSSTATVAATTETVLPTVPARDLLTVPAPLKDAWVGKNGPEFIPVVFIK